MNKYAWAKRAATGFLAIAALAVAPAIASAGVVRDSEEFNGYLAQARSEAVQVQRAAEEMYTYKFSKVSWQTQAAKLDELKTHLNNLGEFVIKMNKVEAPSPWQQMAISDVTPMVEELAGDVTMTIFHLDAARQDYMFSSFPEYVEANADLATNTAALLGQYVEFSEAKQTVDDISFELELPIS